MSSFRLNGVTVTYNGAAGRRLLEVLREDFSCTGVKCGCNEGECGACSVILNGALVNSCLVAMGMVAGGEVITIEGFRHTPHFAVLDRAFAAVSAVQCGYCIPGMILAAHCLLTTHPNPTTEEIRRGLSGNLCRCTGYNAIVTAVELAAREGGGLW